MKPTLFMCTLVLAGSAFVGAQQQTSPSTPPGSTPPTFPTGEATRPAPETPAPAPTPSTSEQQPGNTTASSTSSTSQTGADDTTRTSLEGCLSQASSGGAFALADSSGNSYLLQGDTAQLAKHVGEQIRVSGSITHSSAASNPVERDSSSSVASSAPASGSAAPDVSSTGASNSRDDLSKSASASKFFKVKSVNTISSTCAATNLQK